MLSPIKDPEKITLVFLPFAGGTGEFYHSWLNQLHPMIEGQYAQLPGRGRYFIEPAYNQLKPLVNDLCQEILALDTKQLALFGHSMGALIAFECARQLYFENQTSIQHLFVSGHRAPRQPYTRAPLHQLSKKALFDEMIAMGGMPNNLSFDEIMPFFPTLYSDFSLCETYQYQEKTPLPIPFSLVYGRSDGYIHQETLNWWQKETSMPLRKTILNGDHFYLNHHQQTLIKLINQQLVGDNNALNCQPNG
tara:strand:+ start:7788 stop:8534 length:747 start_codon:yes stop_codon:yes gene_type:complete